MKITLRSRFFLFIISSLLAVSATTMAIAQEPQDSLEYYKRLALRPQKARDFFKATVFFDNSFKADLKKKDTLSAINSLYYTASLLYKRGAYNDSETTAVHALSLLDNILKSDHTNQVRRSFNNLLGMIYTEQNNEVKAVELYTKVLAIITKASDSAMVFNNLANVYKTQNKFLKAQTFLLQAEALLPRVKEPLKRAKIIDNLGLINSY
jgi:tetratricopeptide (TPR) repeat protein